ncbi:hypothetical protein GOP47_0026632 [Adiantum capillus-veneris]|nr:hypothetical protein GOP47_0026632 [Adiantum capillus-veneris]
MGPKKRGDARSRKGTSSSSSASRPAKSVAQVQLSAENQHRLRRLLQNTNNLNASSSARESIALKEPLEKQQAAKRLRNIYEKLVSEGFSTSQIELGLSSLPPGEAALSDVLDWLCLNVPGDELPKKFSSGGVNVDMEGASVQLLAAAKEDWVPPNSTPCDFGDQDDELGLVVKTTPSEENEQDKDMKAKQADWIRQYMNQLAEEDEGSSPSTSGGADLDWEVLAESVVSQRDKTKETVSNREARAVSIASEFHAAKAAAADAKQKGDKQKQVVSGNLIRKLKEEIAALGLSEDILSASSSAYNSVPSKSGIDVDSFQVEQLPIDHDLGLSMQMDVHGDGSPEKVTRENVKHDIGQSESEDGMPGMFDEENATQDVLPASILDIQNREKAMARALQTSEKKHWQQMEKKPPNQRQPKAILQQQCQKRGWDVPKYERGTATSTMYSYNVTVMRPNSGRGKNKIVGGKTTYRVPERFVNSKSIEEAQNVVATWALFSLFPELPLYHIIPEPYRTMMLQWHAQGSEAKIDDDDLEQNRRAIFIESLVNIGKQQRDVEREDVCMLPSKSLDSEHHVKISFSDNSAEEATIGIEAEEEKRDTSRQESRDLLLKYQETKNRKDYKEKLQSRERLPIFSAKDELLHQIRKSSVVVISGETGSGKTTQVPQYILEDLITSHQGAFCNIVCTQPRRLAAISIAERVALEQDEGPPGSSGSLVGYQVRLDSAWHRRTKLLFCTTGILLRRLAGDRDLSGVSHVIVDEVHERSVLGDFILTILKDLIERRRRSRLLPLKIILMSATVDASIFSSYFGDCPVVKVQGRTFPVETIYLEDIYEMLDYQLASDSPAALKNSFFNWKNNKASRNLVSGSRGRQNLVQYGWGDEGMLEEEACNPYFDESLYQNNSLRTKNNLRKLNEDVIDFDLLEELIMHVDKTGEEGAILVFLPGMGDILSLVNRLVASEHFGGASSNWILVLHSSISVIEQQRAFQIPPRGVRKIVVATNIAETSITIEDVVHVIDCGKHKEMRYDPRRGMSRMEEAWVSQANVKQRSGRAGRVQPGYCFALYTKYRFQDLLRPFQLPEMLRQVRREGSFLLKTIFSALQAIEHPKMEAVDSAIHTLREVGALDSNEELTPLGFHLAKLPVDVHVGKMILYGAVLGCVSPILTIAACLSYKSPFSAPREQISAAEKAKRSFVDAKKSNDSSVSICRGQQSDQLAIAAAYNSWSTVLHKHGARAGYEYCKANYLSTPTLIMLRDLRLQFAVLLADIGFISLQEVNNLKNGDLDHWMNNTQRPFNCTAHLPSILKATMCAGLYPNVAKMDDESVKSGHANALTSRAGLASSQKVLWTDGRQEVFIHPSSVNHDVSEFQHPFLMYHEKVKTSKVYIRDTTIVSPYTLLLFGGAISVQHQTGHVSVDGWLKMNAPAQTAVLFKELRAALDVVLEELIKNPKESLGNSNKEVASYIVKLLVDEEKVQ